MPYREIPDCPEPDHVPEPSFQEELRRFNKQIRAVALASLLIQLITVAYYFLFR